MDYIKDCLEKFDSLPENIKAGLSSSGALKKIGELELEYGASLKFAVVLLAIGDLDFDNLIEYLQLQFNLSAEDAAELKNKLLIDVFNRFLTKPKNPYMDNQSDVEDIFSENLVKLLKDNNETKANFNEAAILMIYVPEKEETDFKAGLIKSLYNNEEILTTKPFVLGGKNVKPTVANWIKDFVQYNGSGIFNILALSEYLSASANSKILDQEEKNLLNKLLKLYRNLVFFPESMDEADPEKWELVPLDKEIAPEVPVKKYVPAPAQSLTKSTGPAASTKNIPTLVKSSPSVKSRITAPVNSATPKVGSGLNSAKSVESISQTKNNTPLKSVVPSAKAVIAPAVVKPSSIKSAPAQFNPKVALATSELSLDDLLKQYPVGSLERKAVEEEIKKSYNKNNKTKQK